MVRFLRVTSRFPGWYFQKKGKKMRKKGFFPHFLWTSFCRMKRCTAFHPFWQIITDLQKHVFGSEGQGYTLQVLFVLAQLRPGRKR